MLRRPTKLGHCVGHTHGFHVVLVMFALDDRRSPGASTHQVLALVSNSLSALFRV